MAKAPDAFRTISEVADALHTPAHVLRFWESKFNQIKPVKRAGGRRYYRPDDIALLAGIKHLLHEQGMTIKGAQKLLREKGVKHVAALVGSPITSNEQKTETPQSEDAAALEPEDLAPAITLTTPAKQPLADLEQYAPRDEPTSLPPRWFTASGKLDTESVRANSEKIVPLLARLEAIRERMRTG